MSVLSEQIYERTNYGEHVRNHVHVAQHRTGREIVKQLLHTAAAAIHTASRIVLVVAAIAALYFLRDELIVVLHIVR